MTTTKHEATFQPSGKYGFGVPAGMRLQARQLEREVNETASHQRVGYIK